MKRFSTAWGRSTLLAGAVLLALVACSPEGDKYTSRANDSLNRFETIAEFDHSSENGIASGFVVYRDQVYYADPVRAELICASAERPAIPIPEALFYSSRARVYGPLQDEEPEKPSLTYVTFLEAGNRLYALGHARKSRHLFYYDGNEWSDIPLNDRIYDVEVLNGQLYLQLWIRESDPETGEKVSRYTVVKVEDELSDPILETESNILGDGCIWAFDTSGNVVMIDEGGGINKVANLYSDLGADASSDHPSIVAADERYAVIQWFEDSDEYYDNYVVRKRIISATGEQLMTEQEIGDPERSLQVQRLNASVDDRGNLWFMEYNDARSAKKFGTQRLHVFDGVKLHSITLLSKARSQLFDATLTPNAYGATVAGGAIDWKLTTLVNRHYVTADRYLIDVRFENGEFSVENINLGKSAGISSPVVTHGGYAYSSVPVPVAVPGGGDRGSGYAENNQLSRYALLPASR